MNAHGRTATVPDAPEEGASFEARPTRASRIGPTGHITRSFVASSPPRLETERLLLRPLSLDDVDALTVLLGDREALAEWGEPLDLDESKAWINRNLGRYESHGFGRSAVVLKENGELVGDCGLIPTLVEGASETELGWVVRRDNWGKGIATEAAVAWRNYAFEVLGLDRIVSMIGKTNVASRRVAEKLGMRVEREAVWEGLPFLMYALEI